MEPAQFNDPNIGLKFGDLLLIERVAPKPGRGDRSYLCLCDCGCNKIATFSKLKSGHTKSCGCFNKKTSSERNGKDILGKKFGQLTVIKRMSNPPERLKWICFCECGQETTAIASNLISGNTSSCGCLHRRNGKDHPNWKPEIPLEDKLNKRGSVKNPRYDSWRKSVFERDNYTCQISGKTGKLVAHHIEAWNSRPDLRYNIDNGITMLESIHINFHTKYGRGNNTMRQLNKFINEHSS